MAKEYKGYSITQRGNNYRIRVSVGRDSNGKQIFQSTTFKPDPTLSPAKNKKNLTAFALEFENKVRNGRFLDGEKITFSDFADKWLETYAKDNVEATTYQWYQYVIDTKLKPQFGTIKLAKIQPLHITKMYNDLIQSGYDKGSVHKNYSTTSFNRFHCVLSNIFETAIEWRVLEDNPCKHCRPPKVTGNKSVSAKTLTFEQAQMFLESLEKEYVTKYSEHDRIDDTGIKYHVNEYEETRKVPYQLIVFYNVALFGGLRRGENIALTWKDIDFNNNTICINKSTAKVRDENGIIRQVSKSTKTETSNRTIALPGSVMNMLRKWKTQQAIYRLSIGDAWIEKTDYVYTQRNGTQMYLDTPYGRLKKIIKAYNDSVEDPEEKLPMIRLHDLRHTSATLLISENVDVKTVSGRLGHAQTSTTMNIYSHYLKKSDEQASEKLEKLFQKRA